MARSAFEEGIATVEPRFNSTPTFRRSARLGFRLSEIPVTLHQMPGVLIPTPRVRFLPDTGVGIRFTIRYSNYTLVAWPVKFTSRGHILAIALFGRVCTGTPAPGRKGRSNRSSPR